MSQEILDCNQVCIGIEHLIGHGMAQVVTGYLQAGLLCIILYSLLDTPHREGLSPAGSFFHQEECLASARGPALQIADQFPISVLADIDHPVLASLALINVDPSALEIDGLQSQTSHLFDPQTTTKHYHEDGAVTRLSDHPKELAEFFISEVSGQGPGEPQSVASLDRVGDMEFFFLREVMVKAPDAVQMGVDGLGLKPPVQKMIDIVQDLLVGHSFNRFIQPQYKMLKGVHVVLHCMR